MKTVSEECLACGESLVEKKLFSNLQWPHGLCNSCGKAAALLGQPEICIRCEQKNPMYASSFNTARHGVCSVCLREDYATHMADKNRLRMRYLGEKLGCNTCGNLLLSMEFTDSALARHATFAWFSQCRTCKKEKRDALRSRPGVRDKMLTERRRVKAAKTIRRLKKRMAAMTMVKRDWGYYKNALQNL